MRKLHISIIVLLLAGVFMILGCGENKYEDLEALLEREIDVMSTFISDMESAGDADAVTEAINDYTSGMKKLIPQLKEITEKYPDIKTQKDISNDLKAKLNHVDELAGQFQGAMMKTSGYMMNTKVQKAWADFGTVMSEMQGSRF